MLKLQTERRYKETLIEFFHRLNAEGSIQRLIEEGYMSGKILRDYEIYTQYDIHRRVHKLKKQDAKYVVADRFHLDNIRTVEYAIKKWYHIQKCE